MDNGKEFYIVKEDKQDIKLYEDKLNSNTILCLELSITKCPINCDVCKAIYSNKPTGFRIVCRCNCHSAAENKGGKIKW